MASKCRWIPLESNPEVLNKYLKGIGVASDWQFQDIYGLDDELLQMLPSPVLAVMLLYPLTEKTDTKVIGDLDKDASDVYFMRQTIGNACGTVALVHALANNDDTIKLDAEKPFSKFLKASKDLNPDERGKHLEEDKDMGMAHEENAQEGDTEAPDRDTKINKHFVAFVSKNDNLYELDGRKEYPVNHGKAKAGEFEFLQKTAAVVKQFMARDPEEVNFTLLALCKC